MKNIIILFIVISNILLGQNFVGNSSTANSSISFHQGINKFGIVSTISLCSLDKNTGKNSFGMGYSINQDFGLFSLSFERRTKSFKNGNSIPFAISPSLHFFSAKQMNTIIPAINLNSYERICFKKTSMIYFVSFGYLFFNDKIKNVQRATLALGGSFILDIPVSLDFGISIGKTSGLMFGLSYIL